MTNTKALIIGGGIAGPVTAMALQRAGIEAVIYEAREHGSEGVGAFLALAINGLEALRELDLYDVIGALGMDSPRMQISNGRGRLLATLDAPSRTLKRADLYQALRRRGREAWREDRVRQAPDGSGGHARRSEGNVRGGKRGGRRPAHRR
jgi:2-polyprenyl-6-methoxyphenol hydroxylase-like FAD-dependent oxidoreductase